MIDGRRALVLVGSAAVVSCLDGLRDVNGKPRLVVKGGGALRLRLGEDARLTKDLDASFRGDLDEAEQLIRQALHKGWSGFTGLLSDPEEIVRTGLKPPPRRYQLAVNYEGQRLTAFPLEIATAEASSGDNPEILTPTVSLSIFGLPDPDPVAFLPATWQVAQKLHACTETYTDGGPNTRVRDLLDILLIEDLIGIDDWPALRSACEETFAARKKHTWPPTITVYPVWDKLWEDITWEAKIRVTLDEAVAQVSRIIARTTKG
jgi:Nucleotidyl transferase AbiEii toxin, Type IV TA system